MDKAQLEQLYVVEKKSIPDVASLLESTYYTTRQALINAGIPLRSRADGVRAAAHKLGRQAAGKARTFSADHRRNLSIAKRAAAELTAKGLSLKPNGYIEITRGPDKGRGQHVVVMEEHLGRKLAKDEVVHHVDGNRQNNDIDNLQVMTRAEHTRHHRAEESSNGKR